MTIQQHASFDSSAAELNATSKLVKAWESKNAKNAAKAGGISLMALSLAACGGSSTTVTTPVVDTPVVDTPVVDTPTGSNFVLTNSNNQTTGGADNLTGTAGDDKFLALADAALGNGDVLDGAGGTDTLTARFSVAANTTLNTSISNIENVIVDFDDGDIATAETLTVNTSSFTGLETVGVINFDSTSTKEDIVLFSNVASGVGLSIENGDLNSKVTMSYKTTASTTDVSAVSLKSASADTLTIAGVETINITGSGKSTIETLTTTSATKLTVAGDGDVTLKNVDDATKTIDASAATGKVSIDGVGAVDATITGGSGNDTIAMGTTLTAADTISGGLGTDKVIVGGSHTAALTKVTSVESVEVKLDDIGDGATVTVSGTAIASATKFIANANTATDDDDAAVTFTNIENGDEISIVSAGADNTSLADGVAVNVTQAADTTADAYTLSFEGIGAVTADVSNDTGVAKVTVDSVEVLTVNANKSADLSTATNGVEALSVQAATTLDFNGAGALDIDSLVNTTKLTSIDATGMSGKLTIDGIDASKIVVKAGSADTVLSMAGLNNDDQIVGGAGSKDYVTATGVTGLTATTGKLNIQNVETVELNATGANTIDASLMTGVKTLAFSGATPGNQTITNLPASGLNVSIGDDVDEFDNNAEVSIALADETGASDSATVIINNKGGAATDADIVSAATLENLTLSVADPDTGNNAAVTLTKAKAESVTVDGGFGGAVLALGTLANETTTVDLSAYKGEVSFTAGTTLSGMTVTASSSAGADNFTLSAKDDTVTVGVTGAVDVDIDGGAGTDTLNLTTTTGFIDTSEIDNFENINFIVTAGTDVTLGGNANDTDGMDDAKAVTISGGNELSTFTVDTTDALAGSTLLKIDASSFEGNIDLNYAAEKLIETMVITGGKLTTDVVTAIYDTTAVDAAYQLSGVEKLELTIDSGGDGSETYTTDLQKAVGLTTLAVATGATGTTYNVDNYVDTTTLQLGLVAATDMDSSSKVVVNGASVAGTADTVNLKLLDTEDTGSLDFDAAGIEKLNIALTTDAESHGLDLAGVTATTGSSVVVTVTGGVSTDGLTISDASSSVDTIDASALLGTLTVTGRDASAMTIKGGTAADTIRMEDANDVLDGGAGSGISDTLVIASAGIVGGFVVDLSSATDQVTTFAGSTAGGAQTGFENIDLTNVTGTYGGIITAAATGSTIKGTANIDSITLGAKADTVTLDAVDTATSTKVDVIKSFTAGTGGDKIEISLGDLKALTAVTDVVKGTPTNSVTAAAAVVEDVAKGTPETLGATDSVVVLTGGTYSNLAAALDDMEAGGTSDITLGAAPTAKDAFIFVWSDGTDSYVSVAATGATNAIIGTGDLSGFDLAKLEGISSIAAGDFGNDNFSFIA